MLVDLKKTYLSYHNKAIAIKQAAYLRHQFPFLGIPKPQLFNINKHVFKERKFTFEQLKVEIQGLWNEKEREFQYAAIQLALYHKKIWGKEFLPLLQWMIQEKSWWDSVDDLAANVLGPFILQYPELVDQMDLWIQSENLWLKRSALIFQLRYKHQTDAKRLFTYCLLQSSNKDFFIKKAIGWALRQYSKTDPSTVKNFIENNKTSLSSLSYKEARKYIK